MTKKTIIAIVVLVAALIIISLIVHKPNTTATNPNGTTATGSTDNSGTSNSSQGSGNTTTVTATSSTSTNSPTIITLDGISPTSGAVGATIFLTGSGFTDSNTILFDSNVAARDVHIASTQGGKQMLFFTVPSSIGPDCQTGQACPQYLREVTPGTYQLSVENTNGKSNELQFNVTQ